MGSNICGGNSLPHLKQQIGRKAAANSKELEAIPDPPAGNVSMIVLVAVLHLEREIKFEVDGGVEDHHFQKKWRQIAANFHGVLEDSRPELSMNSNHDSVGTALPTGQNKGVISLDSDSEELFLPETPNSSSSSKKRRHSASIDTPPQRHHITVPQMTTPTKPRSMNGSVPDCRPCAARFTLQQVQDIIQEGHIGLPNEIDPSATQRIVKLSTEVWEKPLERFLNRTERLCQDMFKEQINGCFGCWRSTAMYAQIVSICEEFLKEAIAFQRQAAARVLQLEMFVPTALNTDVLGHAGQKAKLEILTERRAYLVEEYVENNITTLPSKSGRGNNGHGFRNELLLQKVTDEQLGPDPYSREICFMGVSFHNHSNNKISRERGLMSRSKKQDIRAYYTYALARFVDRICQGIKGELFLRFRNEIGPLLTQKLGVMEPDGMFITIRPTSPPFPAKEQLCDIHFTDTTGRHL